MATRGRKTKRTPEVEKRILDALRTGSSRKDACDAAGISDQTFLNWTHEYLDFLEAVTRAEGQCAAVMAATIYQAAREAKDWRAAESWLKRRRSGEWGDNVSIRADKEAQRIIAEMLGESAEGGAGRASENTP